MRAVRGTNQASVARCRVSLGSIELRLAIEKEFVERKPRTTAVLTDDGQALMEAHIDVLQTLIDGLDE